MLEMIKPYAPLISVQDPQDRVLRFTLIGTITHSGCL